MDHSSIIPSPTNKSTTASFANGEAVSKNPCYNNICPPIKKELLNSKTRPTRPYQLKRNVELKEIKLEELLLGSTVKPPSRAKI